MGSSRLPGKMMKEIGGYPICFWVLYRIKKANLIDSIILATTLNRVDDPLADLARQLGVNVFRGSEEDVLSRFINAAKLMQAQNVVRVCADNPLIAPEEIDRLASAYSTAINNEKILETFYAFNYGPKLGNNYPDGLGAEIFSVQLLKKLDQFATTPLHREHISAYIWDHPEKFIINSINAPKKIAYPKIKLDVDTKEDFNKLNVLCNHLNLESSAVEIVNTYNKLFNQTD